MTDQLIADTQDAHQALIAEAKSLGIKNPHVCKPETLERKISEIKAARTRHDEVEHEAIEVSLIINEFGKKFLDSIGFDFEWLGKLAAQYGIEKYEYLHKFRSFRVYREGRHVDWITVNEFGLLNGKRDMCEILLKHSPVSKERRLFHFNWRA